MSNLQSKLQELTAPKRPASIIEWFSKLSDPDKDLAWDAMKNPLLKTYTLLNIFKGEGLKCSKDTFIPLRKGILDGTIKRTDIDE